MLIKSVIKQNNLMVNSIKFFKIEMKLVYFYTNAFFFPQSTANKNAFLPLKKMNAFKTNVQIKPELLIRSELIKRRSGIKLITV